MNRSRQTISTAILVLPLLFTVSCVKCPCSRYNSAADVASQSNTETQEQPSSVEEESAVKSSQHTSALEHDWWDVPYPSKFDASLITAKQDFISVKDNRFVNEKGETVIFQGVSIADPDKLRREGRFNRKLFEAVKSFGANTVRIPVHPVAWRGLGRDRYFALLDQAIVWCAEMDMYVMIDWHSIGNLVTELFQHPIYETTKQETFEFWRAVSFRYQGIPTVAFYELFNEPTVYNGNLGESSWDQWKKICEEIISIIFSHDKQVIPLVGGFNWAYELEPVKQAPIEREGIAYVSHPYPQKTGEPMEKNWEETFGFVAKKYPLFATEIGYMRPGEPGAHIPVENDGTYGKRITDYLQEKGASWIAWCFHPEWAPPLISNWSFTPTESGAHFREVMLRREGKKK